uniref:Pseudouridine synthase n=1 Tax=uncultured korarchaeote TaxID=161241 RepID=A0A1L2JM55_9CREN|nr:pseudouridine synthase [uncultured korarchaeote]
MKLHRDVPDSLLASTLKQFTGEIFQRPPLKSAVKRRLRVRKIYAIELLEKEGRYVLLRVTCEAGTYIRKLVHDIGEAMGAGAHMVELRRIQVGPLAEEKGLTTLHYLEYAIRKWREEGDASHLRRAIVPMEEALSHLPKLYVKDTAVNAICYGADLGIPGICKLTKGIKKGDLVVVMTLKGEAIALAITLLSAEELLEREYGRAAKTIRVLMDRDIYPRVW